MGAVLSVVAALSAFLLAVSPAGWIATGITVLAEIMFVGAAYFWYKSADAQYKERYAPELEDYQVAQADKCGIDIDNVENAEMLAKQFSKKPSLSIVQAEAESFYNKSAATFAGLAVVTAFIPMVGPAIAAGLAIMSGFTWLRGYFAGKAYKAELAETQAVEVEKPLPVPAKAIPVKDAAEPENTSPAPISSATSSPVLRQSAMLKPVEVDPAVDKAHQEIAAKLNRRMRAA